jgi:hypothetical protein
MAAKRPQILNMLESIKPEVKQQKSIDIDVIDMLTFSRAREIATDASCHHLEPALSTGPGNPRFFRQVDME